MEEREIICVVCPSSCHMTVKGENNTVCEIAGFSCNRGKEYGINEFTAPVRTLSTTMKAVDYVSPIIAVRSNRPLPKEKQFECMEIIRNTVARPPFTMGKVVIKNILNTGADIILANC
jgi:CxxC motif-containing protein